MARTLDAPRALVFRAWTDPECLAEWWGPHGVTARVSGVDSRPGDRFRIVMRSSDGVEYAMKGVCNEVVEPARLTYTADLSEHPAGWHALLQSNLRACGGAAVPVSNLLTTVTFDEHGGRTTITIRTRFESAALRDAFLRMGMNEGWSQSLERLAALIARQLHEARPAPTGDGRRRGSGASG